MRATRATRDVAALATEEKAGPLSAGRATGARRSHRVLVTMSDEERRRLVALCAEDVRPIATWFRVVIRRAWSRRRPRRCERPFQRCEDDGQLRQVEVWTRLSAEERDQLDVLAREAGVSTSVWFRARLRACWAQRGP